MDDGAKKAKVEVAASDQKPTRTKKAKLDMSTPKHKRPSRVRLQVE